MSLDVWLKDGKSVVFEANITHNLNTMAEACGVYHACWRPEEIHCSRAKHILPLLESGVKLLKSHPGHYKQFDSPNGWGLYVHFLSWLEKYAEACRSNPEAKIRVSR